MLRLDAYCVTTTIGHASRGDSREVLCLFGVPRRLMADSKCYSGDIFAAGKKNLIYNIEFAIFTYNCCIHM